MPEERHWKDWIGNSQTTRQLIDPAHAEKVAVTLNAQTPALGEPLPACWHWAWFNDARPKSHLGRDGHPKLGGFLPPLPLPRRMWAGGQIRFKSPLIVGNEIEKISQITDIKEKKGKTGKLFILEIEHHLLDGGKLCVNERQNLVYREDPKPGQPPTTPPDSPHGPDVTKEVTPDPVLMFRYSAVTFNGHRIHYDADYARDIEGYPGLVFHAPLTATMLAELCCALSENPAPVSFKYRATSPLFANETFRISAKHEDNGIVAWATNPRGDMAMFALATF